MKKAKIYLEDIINLNVADEIQKNNILHLFSEQNGIELAHITDLDNGMHQICIHYTPNIVTLNSLRALLQTQGYDLSNNYQTAVFAIQDMGCNDCILSLEYAFKDQKGILGVSASYVGKNIRFEFYTSSEFSLLICVCAWSMILILQLYIQ